MTSFVFKIWQFKSSWVKCFTFSGKTEDFLAKTIDLVCVNIARIFTDYNQSMYSIILLYFLFPTHNNHIIIIMLEMYLGIRILLTHVFVTLHIGFVWYALHYINFADGNSELVVLPQIFGTAFWHLQYDMMLTESESWDWWMDEWMVCNSIMYICQYGYDNCKMCTPEA